MIFSPNIDIRPYLTLDVDLLKYPLTSFLDVLPPGWRNHPWSEMILEMGCVLHPFSVDRVWVEKGLLRFHGHSEMPHNRHHNKLFDCVAQQIAKASSMVCMVCGDKGFRKKTEIGWPCLCEPHYIEYVNFLDQNK